MQRSCSRAKKAQFSSVYVNIAFWILVIGVLVFLIARFITGNGLDVVHGATSVVQNGTMP